MVFIFSRVREVHEGSKEFVHAKHILFLVVGTRIGRKNPAALDSARRRLAEADVELVAVGSGRAYMRAGTEPPARDCWGTWTTSCCPGCTRAPRRC